MSTQRLPTAISDAVPRSRHDAQQQSISVVVIADAPSFQDVICSMLQRAGRFEVMARATDAIDGFLAVAALHPQLVLLDVSGAPTSCWLAANLIAARFPDIRLALMSVAESMQVRERCFAAGAHAFIAKRRFREDFAFACAELFFDQHSRRAA